MKKILLIIYLIINLGLLTANEEIKNIVRGNFKYELELELTYSSPYSYRAFINKKYQESYLENLEIVKIIEIKENFVCALYRYPIVTKFFKESIYLRKAHDNWYLDPKSYYYYSEYGDIDPYDINDLKKTKSILKEIKNWEENSVTFLELMVDSYDY